MIKNIIIKYCFYNSKYVANIFIGENKQYIPKFLLMLLGNFICAVSEGIAFGLLMLALSSLTHELPLSLLSVCSFFHLSSNSDLFLPLVVSGMLFQGFKSLLSYLVGTYSMKTAVAIGQDAQKKIYRHVFQFDFPTINGYKIGELTELIRSPSRFFLTYISYAKDFVLTLSIGGIYLALMTMLSPFLTGSSLCLIPPIAWIMKLITRCIQNRSIQHAHAEYEMTKQATQDLNGIRAIYTYNRQDFTYHKITSILLKTTTQLGSIFNFQCLNAAFGEFISIFLVASLLIIAHSVFNSTVISMTTVIAYIGLSYRFATRMQGFNTTLSYLASLKGSAHMLDQILTGTDKTYRKTEGASFTQFAHGIHIDHLSFHYPHTSKMVLSDVSLEIEKSSAIAIVGHSGAGKSTLVDLLLGLYTPTQGSILVDGKELSTYSMDDWRSFIGVVSQDVFIFNETIAENIQFGKLNASQDEIEAAAKQAGAHDFISHLPEGYQTLVGEKGYKLSGGEKQRLALARTLVRQPEILILDEATSNLDSESERLVQEALDEFYHKKTLIVIAHRLSTVQRADKIYVLNQGKVVEQGSHGSLIELGGCYANFWTIQTQATSALI